MSGHQNPRPGEGDYSRARRGEENPTYSRSATRSPRTRPYTPSTRSQTPRGYESRSLRAEGPTSLQGRKPQEGARPEGPLSPTGRRPMAGPRQQGSPRPQPTKRPHSRRAVPNQGFQGLAVWAGPAIIAAALLTGMLISLGMHSFGKPYLACFILGAVITTLLVQARGLFITVSSIPILFGIITPITAWSVSRAISLTSGPKFSTTAILSAIYPLAQHFPVLCGTTFSCVLIAVLRLWLLNRQQKLKEQALLAARRRDQVAERRNLETAGRARRAVEGAPNELSVEELVRRNREARERARSSSRISYLDRALSPDTELKAARAERTQRYGRRYQEQANPRRRSLGDDLYQG